MTIGFEDFLMAVPEEHRTFVCSLHERLTRQGCSINIKEAKTGYVVSYQWEKRTVMNWVFRNAGIFARVYGNNAGRYEPVIGMLPDDMKKKMTGARDCKRLIDPSSGGGSRCVKGIIYTLGGQTHKKCRNDGMYFLLSGQNGMHIQELVMAEVKARQAIVD